MLLYEDNYLIAINKPNNILVHHAKMANNVFEEKSLVEILKETYSKKYYPIHRLDRKTSGVVLFAKEKEFIFPFQKIFQENKIKKVYYGIVRGFTPKNLSIDSDVKGRDALVYKTAFTKLERLEKIEVPIAVTPYQTSRYSLVKLTPKTGRLHQLRIHTNKISHPLIGDPKYGDRFHNRMFAKQFDCNKLFLHAKSITFEHPFLDSILKIEAPFSKDWHKIGKLFNWNIITNTKI